MRVRAVMYATLFTAGLQALAIFATQEQPASGSVLAAHSAPGAPKPAPARVDLPVAAPSIMPAPLHAAIEPTRVALDAAKPANAAGVTMASATWKLNNTRPLYDLMVRKHRMVRQRRWLAMNYARPQPSNMYATGNY